MNGFAKRGYSLAELLVAMIVAFVLAELVAATSSGAPLMSRNAYGVWYLGRQLISGDMPDRWSDVRYMVETPGQFPPASLTLAPQVYAQLITSNNAKASAIPRTGWATATYALSDNDYQ